VLCTRRLLTGCSNVLLIECWLECKELGNFCNWQFAWHRTRKSAFDNWPAVIYSLFEPSVSSKSKAFYSGFKVLIVMVFPVILTMEKYKQFE
jgi:hypothetical protein